MTTQPGACGRPRPAGPPGPASAPYRDPMTPRRRFLENAGCVLLLALVVFPWSGKLVTFTFRPELVTLAAGSLVMLSVAGPWRRAHAVRAAAFVSVLPLVWWLVSGWMHGWEEARAVSFDGSALVLLLAALVALSLPPVGARRMVTCWRAYGWSCRIFAGLAVAETAAWFAGPGVYRELPWVYSEYYFYDGRSYHSWLLRAHGGLGFPNDLGRYLLPWLVVGAARAAARRRAGQPQPGRSCSRWSAAFVLPAVGLLLTFSRSAWLVAASGAAAAALWNERRLPRLRDFPPLARGLMAAAAPLILWRLSSLLHVTDRSLVSRLVHFGEGMGGLLENPWQAAPGQPPVRSGSVWFGLAASLGLPFAAALGAGVVFSLWRRERFMSPFSRGILVSTGALAALLACDISLSGNVVALFLILSVTCTRISLRSEGRSAIT